MNVQFFVGAMLLFVAFGIHVFAGEKTDVKGLMQSNVPANYKAELRMTFHVIAVDCLISGIYLVVLAFNNTIAGMNLLANFTALRFAAYGVMAFFLLLFTKRDHLLKFPQWVSLIIIGGVMWWGTL